MPRRALTLRIWSRSCAIDFAITIVLVNHDIDEAVYLSDRVVVLSKAPSTVLADIGIDLVRPRDQIATKASDQFVAKRAEVARLIRRN